MGKTWTHADGGREGLVDVPSNMSKGNSMSKGSRAQQIQGLANRSWWLEKKSDMV